MKKRIPTPQANRDPAALRAAAARYEAAGELEKAAVLYLRSGEPLHAAGIHMRTKNYLEAVKIFRNEGDHLRAAQALELRGDAAAAAREYSAAGNHGRAARLFVEELLYAEAAEAYRPLLSGAGITARNASLHTTYAALLTLAGNGDHAAAIYRQVLAAAPGHLRAASGLQSLLTRTPAAPRKHVRERLRLAPEDVDLDYLELAEPLTVMIEAGEVARHACMPTLGSMPHGGRWEPRAGMSLWVRAMRALAERHGEQEVFGCLTPESIAVDREAGVLLEAAAEWREPYVSPEVQSGFSPDCQSDIYSMGVILFALLTGGTDQFRRRRAGDLFADVPPWLDNLIERCTEPAPARRFHTTAEVSAALLRLRARE